MIRSLVTGTVFGLVIAVLYAWARGIIEIDIVTSD